jgi:hypothetical protein
MSTPPLPGPERSRRAFRLLLAVLVVVVVGGGLAAVVLLVPSHHKSTATRPPDPTASVATDRGASASVSASGTSSSGAPSSTTGDPSASLQQQITADYRRFLSVNDQVFNSSTANVNLLSSVATGDELTHLVELATQMRGHGYVSTGETRVVSTSVVVGASKTSATVTACIDASGSSTIDVKTGQTVGKEASGHQIEVVYMTSVASTWKVSGGPPQPTAGTC